MGRQAVFSSMKFLINILLLLSSISITIATYGGVNGEKRKCKSLPNLSGSGTLRESRETAHERKRHLTEGGNKRKRTITEDSGVDQSNGSSFNFESMRRLGQTTSDSLSSLKGSILGSKNKFSKKTDEDPLLSWKHPSESTLSGKVFPLETGAPPFFPSPKGSTQPDQDTKYTVALTLDDPDGLIRTKTADRIKQLIQDGQLVRNPDQTVYYKIRYGTLREKAATIGKTAGLAVGGTIWISIATFFGSANLMAIHYEDGACGNFTQSDDFWLKLWAMFGTAPFTADTLKTVTLDAKKLFPKKCCTMLAQSQAIQNGSQKKDDDKLVNVTLLSDVESRLVTKELNDAAAKWGSSDPTLTIEKYDSPSNKCSSIPKTLFKLFFAALYASYDAYNAGIALDCLGWGTAGFVVGIAGNALCTGATGYYAAEEVWRLCENTFCSRNEDIHKKEVKKVSQKLRNITAKQQEIDREKFNAILKESKLDGSTLDEIDIYNHLRKQGTKKQAHPCCIPARKNTLQGLAIMGYTAFAAVSMASIFSSQAYIKMAETLGIGINGTEISYTALNGTISQLCDAASRRTLLILTPEDYSTLLLGGTWATTSYLAQGAGTTIILVKTIRDGVRLYHILKDPESRAIFFSRPIAEQVFDVAGLTLMSGFLVGYLWNIAGTYYPALQSTYLSQCLGWISPPAWLKVGVGMASLAGTFIKGGPSMSNGLNHLVHHFYHTAPDLADTMTEQAKAQGIPLNPGKHYPLVHGNPQPGIELVD